MRRTKALRLVLLGGGATTLLAACGDDSARAAECARARAEMRPNAEQICQRSTSRSSTSFGRSWFNGRTSSPADTASSAGSSSRSGFGGSSSSSSS